MPWLHWSLALGRRRAVFVKEVDSGGGAGGGAGLAAGEPQRREGSRSAKRRSWGARRKRKRATATARNPMRRRTKRAAHRSAEGARGARRLGVCGLVGCWTTRSVRGVGGPVLFVPEVRSRDRGMERQVFHSAS